MDNQNFLNEEWFVAPKTMHLSIMESKLSGSPAIRGVRLMTMDTLLATLFPVINENSKLFTSAYSIIQEKRKDCIVLSETICYPEFTRQVIDFVIFAHQNDMDFAMLPKETPKEKDLAICIEAIEPLYRFHNTLRQLTSSPYTFEHVTIYPFYMQPHHHKIVDLLVERGARKIEHNAVNPISFQYHQALNTRQEAEAVAQWLCQNPFERVGIIHCDPMGTKVLTSVLDRYHIPYQQTHQRITPALNFRFLALLKLLRQKTSEALIESLTHGVFECSYRQSLIDYIQHFDLTFNEFLLPFSHVKTVCDQGLAYIDKRNQAALLQLEHQAAISQSEILSDIQTLIQSSDPIVAAFDHFAKNFASLNTSEKAGLLAIKDIIESCLLEINDYTDIVLPYLIEQITVSDSDEIAPVIITDLRNSELPPCDHVIILGVNQRNYPGFSPKSGLFDEGYLQKTTLPSLKDRLNLHMKYVESLFTRYPHLICSYASGNYEGKSVSSAYQLDVFSRNLGVSCTMWPLVTHGKTVLRQYRLKPELSSDLFFKENTLKGSVSSFERFFQCPYQYYFQYGLKINKLQTFELNNAFVGTIQHAVFEKLANAHPKNYPNTSKSDLTELLNDCFKDLRLLYPKLNKQWDMVQTRMTENLMMTFERLQPMEQDTDFEVKYQEHKFAYTWPTRHDISIALNGIIDRIDMTPTTYRIVDYKSSAKKLKKDKVMGGLQLQLLTYLIITSKMFRKTPVGAFYLSMRNLDVSIPRYKFVRNEAIPFDGELSMAQLNKNHKMTGWFVVDRADLFRSRDFVQGLKNDNYVDVRYKFELQKIEALFSDIYSYLVSELSAGNIQRRPTENACKYCDYASACWYKGRVEDPLKISDIKIGYDKEGQA